MKARTKEDLKQYAGKLKNAVVLRQPPAAVAPVTDPGYGPVSGPPAKKDGPEAKKDGPEAKKDDQPMRKGGGGGGFGFDRAFQGELNDFLKAEGAACTLIDSGKPHGLLDMTGGWPVGDRGNAQEGLPRLFITHEHYAMLWRLASRPEPAKTRVEVEITNTFIPGPIVVSNTIGEVRGSEKPDEIVVVGAHLDSLSLIHI